MPIDYIAKKNKLFLTFLALTSLVLAENFTRGSLFVFFFAAFGKYYLFSALILLLFQRLTMVNRKERYMLVRIGTQYICVLSFDIFFLYIQEISLKMFGVDFMKYFVQYYRLKLLLIFYVS